MTDIPVPFQSGMSSRIRSRTGSGITAGPALKLNTISKQVDETIEETRDDSRKQELGNEDLWRRRPDGLSGRLRDGHPMKAYESEKEIGKRPGQYGSQDVSYLFGQGGSHKAKIPVG